MNSNARLSIRILLIALIGWISVPAVNAQPNLSSPETIPSQPALAQPQQPSEIPPPPSEQPQQNSYVGFGGVIGLQGSTTFLSTI
jgi:hypothetical protein